MSLRRYSNTAVSTLLNANIAIGATSLVVNSATGFPAVPFTIRVNAEVILVRAKSGTTFSSLVRAFDSTTAIAHVAGEVVEHIAIADDFDYRWEEEIVQYPHDTYDDEFDDEDYSGWTLVAPSGTSLITEARGMLSVVHNNIDVQDCVALVKSIGALPPTIRIDTAVRAFNARQQYCMLGPVFSDGTTTSSNIVWANPYLHGGDDFTLGMYYGTFQSVSGSHINQDSSNLGPWLYVRLHSLGTNNWRVDWSMDGVSYTTFGAADLSNAFSPTHFGLGWSSWGNAGDSIATFDHFRVNII